MTITQRFFVSIRVMALTIIAVVVVVTVPVTGQESTYTAPRTPDGQPDLQGFWSNQTYTPLERPDGVTKEFYTEEEVAEIETGRTQGEVSQTTPGTIPDVHYDFTQFGLDRSQSGLTRSLRTSLIVDPPNGKLPPTRELWRLRVTNLLGNQLISRLKRYGSLVVEPTDRGNARIATAYVSARERQCTDPAAS